MRLTMKIGSLFTGYGGLDMAVGGDLAWYSEIEPAACKVLTAHHPGVPNLGDITAVDWTTVEPVDVLTGGYPCQPFSHAGKRKGSKDERHLWPYVRDAIDALRPGLVVLENVRGHLSLGFGDVIADLSRVGYDARWGVVRAADAGAPHGRARIFIAAYPYSRSFPRPPVVNDGLPISAERGSDATADADGHGHGSELHPRGMADVEGQAEGGSRERQWPRCEPDARGTIHWGEYEPAIHRWEHVLGRVAPAPTVLGRTGRARLNPQFVEWMMGLPDGHVTGHSLSAAQELKMLGNGVVPQQAALALRLLGVAA